jgi:hypothetical protein
VNGYTYNSVHAVLYLILKPNVGTITIYIPVTARTDEDEDDA